VAQIRKFSKSFKARIKLWVKWKGILRRSENKKRSSSENTKNVSLRKEKRSNIKPKTTAIQL